MNLLHGIYFNITDDLKGIAKIWLVSDNFFAESYRKYFKKSSSEFYMKENYEIVAFCSSKYSDRNLNALSRLVNSFIEAMNTKFYLPDYIIFMLDDDLIQYMQYTKFKVASLYRLWIEYLTELVTETVHNHHSSLIRKARTSDITQIYWVEPINHSNFDYIDQQLRDKFLQCLDLGCKAIDKIRVLKLKDSSWDKTDDNLVYNNRITKNGLHAYWHSIDASFEFNVKKRQEFLIRSKFHALKLRSEEKNGHKALIKSKRLAQEDLTDEEEDEMKQFFNHHRKLDKIQWSKNKGNRFILPCAKAKF